MRIIFFSLLLHMSLRTAVQLKCRKSPENILTFKQGGLASAGDGVLAGVQCQLAVLEDLPEERNAAGAERIVVGEKGSKIRCKLSS